LISRVGLTSSGVVMTEFFYCRKNFLLEYKLQLEIPIYGNFGRQNIGVLSARNLHQL